MVERSPEGSFVWAYGPQGVEVIPAQTVANGQPPPPAREQDTVGERIADGIACVEGDPGIGRSVDGDAIESLNDAMTRLGAPVGLSFTATLDYFPAQK